MHKNVLHICFALWLALGCVLAAPAQAVKCTAVHGALLMPTKTGKWDALAANTNVPAERMIVALFGGEFTTDAVDVKVLADVGQRGPFPVLEAAVTFHATPKIDLDVSLDRGILVVTNARRTGAAKIQVRVADEKFDIALSDPKSRVGIEIYGRHVAGPPNLKSVKDDLPVINAAFFALEGEVIISNDKHATRLHSPPGPTLYHWDNLTRAADVHRFETLPDSVKPFTADELKLFESLASIAKAWAAKPAAISKSLTGALDSKNPLERKAAVVALGAVDDLPGLYGALTNNNHADARDTAVLAIRHYLGRAPGKSIELFNYLTKSENYTPTQAKNLIHLFNGIQKDRLRQPDTYEMLIDALNHPKMAGRELARWHLVRLVPDGKSITYDAAAPEAERTRAVEAWRKLVPPGELPPPPKKKSK
jgi:hypothetical protein